jgi:hypothetical protein
MRVKIKNAEGRGEVLLIESAAISISNDQLRLTRPNNAGVIFVDVGCNYAAHQHLNELLKDGWSDLFDCHADFTYSIA